MSDLYKEALLDAKKVREVAEIDAKNRIMEQISPIVKTMISKEISSKISPSSFLQEQALGNDDPSMSSLGIDEVDDTNVGDTSMQQQPSPPTQPPSSTTPQDSVDMAPEGNATTGDEALSTPITPTGSDLSNVSVPDADGKIVIDFDDLFAAKDGSSNPSNDNGTASVSPPPPPSSSEQQQQQLQQPEGTAIGGTESMPSVPGENPENEEANSSVPSLQPESVQLERFKRNLLELSDKIDSVYFSKRQISNLTEERLKNQIFGLVEKLDQFSEKGLFTQTQTKQNEKKLEFLFVKLNEAISHNSYNKNIAQEGNKTMASLKEFAAQLFEEDEKVDLGKDAQTSGDTGVRVDKDATEHAYDVSGVDPNMGSKENLGASRPASEKVEDSEPDEKKHWDKGEPTLKEEAESAVDTEAHDEVAEGAAGFGDTKEEPVVEFEVDEAELMEAIRLIRKENIQRKMAKLREVSTPVVDDMLETPKAEGGKEGDSWEDGEPEGGESPALESLEEQMDFGASMDDEDEDMDMDSMGDTDEDVMGSVVDDGDQMSGMEPSMDNDGDLVLKLDLPDELTSLLADLDPMDFQVDVEVNTPGGEELEGDADIELIDDSGAGDDDEILLTDDEDDVEPAPEEIEETLDNSEEDVPVMESKKQQPKAQNSKLNEGTLKKAKKLLEQKEAAIKQLQEQLQETNLFTAKAVFLSKFLMREGLSRKVKQQIVEHLDKAKTIVEAKTIYNKIRVQLDEHVSKTSNKLTGSASRVAKSGSANLNESVSQGQNTTKESSFDVSAVARWQQLAKIK